VSADDRFLEPFGRTGLRCSSRNRCKSRPTTRWSGPLARIGSPRPLTAALSSCTTTTAALVEIVTLGRTLKKRAADVLAYFDRPGTSNGPTEAINGRLEHLRGSALGFRNLTNYIARSLLETGGFRPQLLHPRS
jgi:hypothetical protein